MRYFDIKHGKGMPDKRTINISVRFLGFSKVVIVRTRLTNKTLTGDNR